MPAESCTRCNQPIVDRKPGCTLLEVSANARLCWRCVVDFRSRGVGRGDPRRHCECHLPIESFPGPPSVFDVVFTAQDHAPWCRHRQQENHESDN